MFTEPHKRKLSRYSPTAFGSLINNSKGLDASASTNSGLATEHYSLHSPANTVHAPPIQATGLQYTVYTRVCTGTLTVGDATHYYKTKSN